MSGEAGPAPGWRAVAGTNPRPAATVSLRTKGLTRVMGSDGSQNLDTLIGRTCLRGTQTRRPRCREHPDSGANKTAGMRAKVGNDQTIIPRARVPVGLVHHPAGTSRATGQAMVDIPSGGLCQSRTLRPVERWDSRFNARRRLARGTHAAGQNAERGAGRSHIHYLDRLLLAPRPIPRVKPEDKFQATRREQSRPAATLAFFDNLNMSGCHTPRDRRQAGRSSGRSPRMTIVERKGILRRRHATLNTCGGHWSPPHMPSSSGFVPRICRGFIPHLGNGGR
jgi:hypothetical protein